MEIQNTHKLQSLKQRKNNNPVNNFQSQDQQSLARIYKFFKNYSIQQIHKLKYIQQVPLIPRQISHFLKLSNKLNCSQQLSQFIIKQKQYQNQIINKIRKIIYKSHNLQYDKDQNDFQNNCLNNYSQQQYVKIKDQRKLSQYNLLQQRKIKYLLIYDIIKTKRQKEKKIKILKQLQDLIEREKVQQKKKEKERKRKELNSQVINYQSNNNNLNNNIFQMSLQQLQLQYKYLLSKSKQFFSTIIKITQQYCKQSIKIDYLKEKKQQNYNKIAQIKSIITLKQHSIKQQNRIQKQLIAQIKKGQQILMKISQIKKAANNELQDTRGNIRVYCRIRPCFNNNVQKINYKITDSSLTINKVNTNNIYEKQQIQKYQYIFQKIFDENATQAHIFDKMMDLVQNALDGKNVCIFAYGQTGSGKTYTMNGERYHQQIFSQSMGIIPRSLKKIFHQIKQLNEYQQTEVQLSIFQIYNQNINDLLLHFQENQKKDQQIISKKEGKKSMQQKKLIFNKKLSDKRQTFKAKVQSYDEAMKLFYYSMDKRSTAETLSNAKSSRSHLIFQIKLSLKFKQKTRCSNLVLVDLAGSQRIKMSGAEGDRRKQATFINNSLTQLGKMMREIKSNNNHISFRNCVLTKILQQYLQGDGKAVMFVNVSPQLKDQQITLQSLKFASDVKDCKVGNNNGNNSKNGQTSNISLNFPY